VAGIVGSTLTATRVAIGSATLAGGLIRAAPRADGSTAHPASPKSNVATPTRAHGASTRFLRVIQLSPIGVRPEKTGGTHCISVLNVHCRDHAPKRHASWRSAVAAIAIYCEVF
jgi:hypothetical protein